VMSLIPLLEPFNPIWQNHLLIKETMEVKKCATCANCNAHPPKFTCTEGVKQLTRNTIEITNTCPYYKVRVTTASEGSRPLEERKASVDIDRVAEFSQAMAKKWSKGRTEYGVEFKFDPMDEAMAECVDIANYSLELYFRLRKLKEKAEGLKK